MALRVLVIIPAYNEQECIVDVVRRVVDSGYDYVVINDGSTDRTSEICHDAKINVLDLPQNLGIGGAVQAGHKYAQRYGYDVDVQFDGDGQHDEGYIISLVQAVESGADLAIGSRFMGKGEGFKSTRLRRVGISWLTFVIKCLTGKTVTDPTSGFRACSRRAIELYSSNYPLDYPEPESVALAVKCGLRVQDVPVIMHERQSGSSSIRGLRSAYYMVKVTLAIAITCITRKGLSKVRA